MLRRKRSAGWRWTHTSSIAPKIQSFLPHPQLCSRKPAVVSISHSVPTDHKDLLPLTFLPQFIPVTQSLKPAGIHWSTPAEQNRKRGNLNEDPHHPSLFSSVNQSPSVIPNTVTPAAAFLFQAHSPSSTHVSCGSHRPSTSSLSSPMHCFVLDPNPTRHPLLTQGSLIQG